MNEPQREFDVVVMGASGFTGRLVAAYLQHHFGGSPLRWAIAGRNPGKLERVAADIGATDVPVVTADSDDMDSLHALAGRARVIATTVGPYARHGSQLVSACVNNGTDYCDLAGEVPWIRRMIDTHEATAKATGARIVHCCGFDSIPSDLGVLFVQDQARERYGETCREVKYRVKATKGGPSGGTVASLILVVEAAREDRRVARIVRDPYAFCPAGQRTGPDRPDQSGPLFDKDLRLWTGPFVMAAINTKVVRRSNALMGYPYGEDFRYSEAVITGEGLAGRARALVLTAGLGGLMAGAAFKPTRHLLTALVLPKPGEGPNRQERENGFFHIRLLGKLADGRTLEAKVTADRDPGYGATCGMLAESALTLANDIDRPRVSGGFWTPASALGNPLIERLRSRAGISFDVLPEK